MSFTRTKFTRALRIAALILAIIVIVGYAAFRSLPYFRGPSISILHPLNGSTISSTTATVIGRAQRITSISMNGQPMQVDEVGNFHETLIIFPGVNVISFDAADQFKRNEHLEIRVLGTEIF